MYAVYNSTMQVLKDITSNPKIVKYELCGTNKCTVFIK